MINQTVICVYKPIPNEQIPAAFRQNWPENLKYDISLFAQFLNSSTFQVLKTVLAHI